MARLNQRQDTVASQGFDALRRKFGAQNRAIAKSHAALEEKVAQMKDTTDQLLAENYELRCENMRLKEKRDLSIGHVREILSKKWAEIEMLLLEAQPISVAEPLTHTIPNTDAVATASQGNSIDKITRRKRTSSVDVANRSFEDTAVSDEPPSIETVVEEERNTSLTEDSIPEEDETPYEEENRPKKLAESLVLESITLNEETEAKVIVESENEKKIAPVQHEVETPILVEQKAVAPTQVKLKVAAPVQEKPKGKKVSRKPLTAKSVNASPEKRKAVGKPDIRKKQKTSPVENEMMPSSFLSPPRRRSRGAQVNYALPSLRTKMRRKQDEFVDAVTGAADGSEIDIQIASDLVAEVKMELYNDTDIETDEPQSEEGKDASRRASTGLTSSRRRSTNTRRSLAV